MPDLSDLEDQARYHRDRLALYRAKMHGPKETSVARLQELQRAATAAEARLATARRYTTAPSPPSFTAAADATLQATSTVGAATPAVASRHNARSTSKASAAAPND